MLYINGRFLLQHQTGVNRFAYELCHALAQMGVDFILCCPKGKIMDCYDVSTFKIMSCGWGKSHVWEQLALPVVFAGIKGGKLLLNLTGLSPVLVRRKVMTIHDLGVMVHPRWYTFAYRTLYRMLTPLCAATAMKIITVSRFSKDEIVRLLSVRSEKISVVYNAVVPSFFLPLKATLPDVGKERYVLAVSSIDPRKNFLTLLKAFAYVEDKSISLYVVGGENSIYSASIEELGRTSGFDRVRWLGRVSDDSLKSYYSGALCFVYPSFYEGFGIPPLEAMACGTPVIVSDIPPIREVCGDAALYIDPYSEKDMADKINLLVEDECLREELVQKGNGQCRKYDWRKSADLLMDAIKGL